MALACTWHSNQRCDPGAIVSKDNRHKVEQLLRGRETTTSKTTASYLVMTASFGDVVHGLCQVLDVAGGHTRHADPTVKRHVNTVLVSDGLDLLLGEPAVAEHADLGRCVCVFCEAG